MKFVAGERGALTTILNGFFDRAGTDCAGIIRRALLTARAAFGKLGTITAVKTAKGK